MLVRPRITRARSRSHATTQRWLLLEGDNAENPQGPILISNQYRAMIQRLLGFELAGASSNCRHTALIRALYMQLRLLLRRNVRQHTRAGATGYAQLTCAPGPIE